MWHRCIGNIPSLIESSYISDAFSNKLSPKKRFYFEMSRNVSSTIGTKSVSSQLMTWRRWGDKLYYLEQWWPRPLTKISVIMPQYTSCHITLWWLLWYCAHNQCSSHYSDVIMSAMASEITSITIVYSSVYSGADQRKHQSSASLAFVRKIHWSPVNSPHKGPVTRKIFPFDHIIMVIIKASVMR